MTRRRGGVVERATEPTAMLQSQLLLLLLIATLVVAWFTVGTARAADGAAGLVWRGDAIPAPLAGAAPGDVQRGRAVVESRQTGLCLLCHSLLADATPLQGNLAPPLAGSGTRLDAGQLRARLVDSRRLQPLSIMPAYFVALPAGGGGTADLLAAPAADAPASVAASAASAVSAAPRHLRIAAAWQGRTLLDAQQIEDVIAFLLTLREPA